MWTRPTVFPFCCINRLNRQQGALALFGEQKVIFESHVTFEDNIMEVSLVTVQHFRSNSTLRYPFAVRYFRIDESVSPEGQIHRKMSIPFPIAGGCECGWYMKMSRRRIDGEQRPIPPQHLATNPTTKNKTLSMVPFDMRIHVQEMLACPSFKHV